MSKTPKKPSTSAPQFVIFDPPIPGFEARAELRKAKDGESVISNGVPLVWSGPESLHHLFVLTPVKRIEDLLPQNLKCEMWLGQDEDGSIVWGMFKLYAAEKEWDGDDVRFVAMKEFNPFGLPVEPNPNWHDTCYHFTPAQGWKKCEAK